MRWLLLCLCVAGALGAQTPLHVVAVEHHGPPPYETVDRVYCLDGGKDHGLSVGDRLVVKRASDARIIGALWVTGILEARAETRFEPKGSIYPMKGDLALAEVFRWMPEASRLNDAPIPVVSLPSTTVEAPPREGLLFYLPQQVELSPAGVKKLEGWVKAWGRLGRWSVQVPADKAAVAVIQRQRAEALVAGLKALGVERVSVDMEPRTTDSQFEPIWIRNWE